MTGTISYLNFEKNLCSILAFFFILVSILVRGVMKELYKRVES